MPPWTVAWELTPNSATSSRFAVAIRMVHKLAAKTKLGTSQRVRVERYVCGYKVSTLVAAAVQK